VRFSKPNGLNQKKGISSIVGGIFFLVLMTAGFTVYYVALDSQSQMLHTQQVIADNEVAKIKEKFVVAASSSGVNNLLSVQVVNTGNNPVEIADVWIINKTDASEPAKKYDDLDFRDVSIPVGYSGNVLENHTPLYLTPTIYDIKVVSSIGTIQKVEYDVNGGSNILRAQMVAIPQDVRFGENATIALIVTNTGDFPIDSVTANTLDVNPNQCSAAPNPIFLGPADLSPSQSVMFFWDCILDPPIGNVITFTGNATGLLSGVPVDSNNAFDAVVVMDFSGGDTIVIQEDLYSKPEIFMIMPGPFGAAGGSDQHKGLWGINVANPTNAVMYVTKVVISLFDPDEGGGDEMLKRNKCDADNISPWGVSGAGDWKCVIDNQLRWKNDANPIQIPPKSVYSFLVKIKTGGLDGSGSADLESLPVQATVLTSSGQFGKGGYASSMNNDEDVFANIFLGNGGTDTSNTNLNSTRTGIISGSNTTFDIWLADFNSDASSIIKANTKLIINIPRDWVIQGTPIDYGDWTITVNTFPDTSSQIVGTLLSDISSGGKRITFTAKAPVVSEAKMYVFHSLANGLTADSPNPFTVSPLTEIVVQVCKTSGCTT